MKIATLATLKEREPLLEQVVAALYPQVDQICVHLHGYDQVPDWLRRPKIVCWSDQVHRDHGAADKWRPWFPDGALVLCCDDDIVYPPDYVEVMEAAVERHSGAVVGLPGSRFQTPLETYYRDRTSWHLAEALSEDLRVHLVGTGACAYRQGTIRVGVDDFPCKFMADVHFAILAKRQDVPLWIVARDAAWAQPLELPAGAFSIFEHFRDHGEDPIIAETINAVSPWPDLGPCPKHRRRIVSPKIRANVVTCERPRLLFDLLQDIPTDWDLHVYDDASTDRGYDPIRAGIKGQWHRFPERLGKEKHWQLVAEMIRDTLCGEWDFLVQLPDDVRLCSSFLDRVLDAWRTITDDRAVTLNLLRDKRIDEGPCWTEVWPHRRSGGLCTDWVDGCFFAPRKYIEEVSQLDLTVPPDRWANGRGHLGSGVYRVISRALVHRGYRMYCAEKSLVVHREVPSQMNGNARQHNPLSAVDFVDGDNVAKTLSQFCDLSGQ